MKDRTILSFILIFGLARFGLATETLPPLVDGKAPQTFAELWNDFDPRAEPLDVEVLKKWEEQGVVMHVLRYRVGVFKGEKAMVAAVYGYPKGGFNMPGLVQIHGGGQYAHSNAVLTNAKRGYATISVSWAGRIDVPGYKVTPDVVKLFWSGDVDHPDYKVTTDWGALDGYHAPTRDSRNGYGREDPSEWTLDAVESARNNPWFLATMACRRALTFLERQEVVDPERLGVYGHSMGGRLTVMTAGADRRVKAAAPSCGGVSGSGSNVEYALMLSDEAYLERIECPVMFLSPSNDFHGRIDDLQVAFDLVKTDQWRATCSPHHNHQDTEIYEVATQLCFDEHLKGQFEMPQTPRSELKVKSSDGMPVFTVRPDLPESVLYVDIYYTQHGQIVGRKDDRENTKARFWHHVKGERQEDGWSGKLSLLDVRKPLWVYANVVYPLDETVQGAGYYYRDYSADRFNLSSRMEMVSPKELRSAGVVTSTEPSLLIESFEGDWEKEWYTYRPKEWGRHTHKVYDDVWKAPAGAKLSFEVLAAEANVLVVCIDGYAAEVELAGGSEWQLVKLSAADFKNADEETRTDFKAIRDLSLKARETLKGTGGSRIRRTVGGEWHGAEPTFRDLKWSVSK